MEPFVPSTTSLFNHHPINPFSTDPKHPRRNRFPRAYHHPLHPQARSRLDEADRHRSTRFWRPIPIDRLYRSWARKARDGVHSGERGGESGDERV